MLDWKPINKVYTYDGSFEGLLTIVFNCFADKTMPVDITPEKGRTETYAPAGFNFGRISV